jgi:hypothetical protein
MVHFRFLVSVFLERALNFLSDLMTSSILFLSAWPLPCERCGEAEEFVTGRQGLVVGSVCLFCKEVQAAYDLSSPPPSWLFSDVVLDAVEEVEAEIAMLNCDNE